MSETDPAVPEHLLERATEVFGNATKARRWLGRPHHAFDDQSPAKVARTEEGLREVLDVLGRIEHGVYE